MKNILIIGGVGVAVYLLLNRAGVSASTGSAAYTSGGLKTYDTQGREIQFQQNKDGWLVDQYGGVWA